MTEQKDLKELIREVLLAVHPVGSLFFTSDDRNPDVILFGGGYSKWKRIEGRFIYGASENRPIGQTGGEESHTLTVNETPAHTHTRGTMEISGRANPIESGRTSQSQDASGLAGSGAFEYQYLDVNGGILLKDSSLIANYSKRGTLDFKASRNWTGATSSVDFFVGKR